MKFSCPNCFAKYQIADEKVAGRTVKMKCRKCGHVIPIHAQPSKGALDAAPVVHAASLKPRAGSRQIGPPTVPAQIPQAIWHAGIGGSAKGPMTEVELRQHVDSGEVNAETYVWSEGMDGWKMLSEVDELSHLLKTAPIAPPPPSMPAQNIIPQPEPAVSLNDGATSLNDAQPVAPAPPVAITEAATETSRPRVTSAAAEQQFFESNTKRTPAAAPQDAPERGNKAARSAEVDSPPKPDLFVAEAPAPHLLQADAGGVTTHQHGPSYESLVARLQETKTRHPWALPIAVVGALVLGVSMGFVIFGDQKTKVVREVVEVRVPATAAAQELSPDQNEAEAKRGTPEQPEEVAAAPANNGAASSGSVSSSSSTKTTSNDNAPKVSQEGLKGLSGLQGLGGPSSGPSATSSAATSGNQLESSQIQSTVSKYQTSVKRGCWQPALDSRDRDAPSSARVTVSITVAPSGSVTGATTGGDPRGYRGLANCISSKVRSWQFPRSSGTTTVNVPFVFAAQ